MSLIGGRGHFERFLKLLPELERDEVYFLSLSARNKYLTEEEREFYSLGRTEMFARQIAHDKEGIEYALKKMFATTEFKRTRNGKYFPTAALVVYININPSSTVRAYRNFKAEMDKQFEEVYLASVNGKDGNYHSFHRMERNLLNEIQKATSRRCFVDVDFDTDNINFLRDFIQFCEKHEIKHHTIRTRSGFHVLLEKDTIRKVNIYEKIKSLHDLSSAEGGGEIIINKNAMVPLPGTRQAGQLVSFLQV